METLKISLELRVGVETFEASSACHVSKTHQWDGRVGGIEGGREAAVSNWSSSNCIQPSFFPPLSFFLSLSHTGHPWDGGNGNTLANTAASHTHTRTHAHTHTYIRHWQKERGTGPELSQDVCVSPLQLPVISKNKSSVSDPEPIRSEAEAHWPIGEAVTLAVIPVTNCEHLRWQQTFTVCLSLSVSTPTDTHTHTPKLAHFHLAALSFLPGIPLSPPPIHFHPSVHPLSLYPFFIFLF